MSVNIWGSRNGAASGGYKRVPTEDIDYTPLYNYIDNKKNLEY